MTHFACEGYIFVVLPSMDSCTALLIKAPPMNCSLVPKERHVRKESNGRTLGLCVVPKESHDCTLVKELTPKESHDCNDINVLFVPTPPGAVKRGVEVFGKLSNNLTVHLPITIINLREKGF